MTPRPICQVEIRTRDVGRSCAFYASLFDWPIRRLGEEYAFGDTGRDPLVAFALMADPEYILGICCYAIVDDCAAASAKVEELGGRVLIPKNDLGGTGWFANTVDPWGNELGLWEPVGRWAPAYKGPGGNPFTWFELAVGDVEEAAAYYERLLGWRFEATSDRPDYRFTSDATPGGGAGLVGGILGSRSRGLTPYVTVADVAATVALVGAGGGQTSLAEGGDFAICLDPEGNRFAVVKG